MIHIFAIAINLYAMKPAETIFSVAGSRKSFDSKRPSSDSPIADTRIFKKNTPELRPDYSIYKRTGYFEAQDDPVKVPQTKGKDKNINLYRGDIVYARINSDIVSYDGSLSPVRAVITEGNYKNSFLVGNSTLDLKSKTISIRFDSFRPAGSKEVHPIEAYVQSTNGKMGLVGEIDSSYWTYFWAELISSGVSGYANSSKETESSFFGSRQKVSPDNAAKGAVADAAASTADLFREKSRSSPEIATAKGPHEIQVFIIKAPDDF